MMDGASITCRRWRTIDSISNRGQVYGIIWRRYSSATYANALVKFQSMAEHYIFFDQPYFTIALSWNVVPSFVAVFLPLKTTLLTTSPRNGLEQLVLWWFRHKTTRTAGNSSAICRPFWDSDRWHLHCWKDVTLVRSFEFWTAWLCARTKIFFSWFNCSSLNGL